MLRFDPYKYFYAFMAWFQRTLRNNHATKWFRRSSRSRRNRDLNSVMDRMVSLFGRMKKTPLVRWISALFVGLILLPKIVDTTLRQWIKKSGASKHLSKPIDWLMSFSRLAEIKTLVDVTAVPIRWFRTRQWLRIAGAVVPSTILMGTLLLAWYSGQRYGGPLDNRNELANWYFELGEEELKRTEGSPDQQNWLVRQASDASTGGAVASALNEGELDDASGFGELLFRRVQLLQPTDAAKIGVARTMLQRGAFVEARRILQKFAPDDGKGKPLAHEVMAAGYLMEFQRTQDASYLPLFQHHLAAGVPWRFSHPEILRYGANILWRQGNKNLAIHYFRAAAERSPEFNLVLAQHALEAGNAPMARSARESGIRYFRRLLEMQPNDTKATYHLALLLSLDDSGTAEAEQLLRKATSTIGPNFVFARALSEVYRRQFLNSIKTDLEAATKALHHALAVDPNNSTLLEDISETVADGAEGRDRLIDDLNSILVSAREKAGIHALLAEYHLGQNQIPQAIVHLEQVFQATPHAAKFANELAHSYAAHPNRNLRDMNKALTVATRARATLERFNLLRNTSHADALLETLGKIHQKEGRIAEAIEAYEKSVEVNPIRAESRRRLAKAYQLRGDLAKSDADNATYQESLANRIEQSNRELTAFENSKPAFDATGVRENNNSGASTRAVKTDG